MSDTNTADEAKGFVAFTVREAPATFATAREAAWRSAVSSAAHEAMAGRPVFEGRIAVELDFVLPARGPANPGWDLDNLIKPTIDALTPVIGARPGSWRTVQTDDERVDEIVARKREVRAGEKPHGRIIVREL